MAGGAPIVALALLVAASPDDTLATLKSAIEHFEFGEHERAAEKLAGLLNPLRLTSAEDVILTRQYLGACYYLLDQRPRAEAEFAKILALDADHRLDPQVFSPALVQFFEEVRARTGVALRRPPTPPPPVKAVPGPILTIEEPPLPLAFVPFGVGQLNNHHPVRGVLFLTTEVGLFATAVTAFALLKGLDYRDGPDGEMLFETLEEANRARTLQTVYLTSFYVGLGVTALGVVEALLSYPGDGIQRVDAPAAQLTF